MYALYKELHPPTAVDYCVTCRFISKDEPNVITSAGHVLRVYKLRKVYNHKILNSAQFYVHIYINYLFLLSQVYDLIIVS